MLLSMLDILTSLNWNFYQASSLRHHVTNFEKIFDTIQDFLISPILKKKFSKIRWGNLEISAQQASEGGRYIHSKNRPFGKTDIFTGI